MPDTFRATLRVTGAGRLREFAERVRSIMVRDIDAEHYTECHREGQLEYRFELKKGLPFPDFAAASQDFPELRVEAEWVHPQQGMRGRAVIENGRLTESATEPLGKVDLRYDVTLTVEDGRLMLAMACREAAGELLGYAANAERHGYFHYAGGRLRVADGAGENWADGTPIEERMLIALEDVAFTFADEWLWFDQSSGTQADLERARYADFGYAVRGANVRSQALAHLRRSGEDTTEGLRLSSLDELGREARAALLAAWRSERIR
ncbi:MAG: hypothetical protein OEW21_17435 [Betaproteobacteria bacterium]|nr:hypothetical protein [Betaproteobacteria bacterium]